MFALQMLGAPSPTTVRKDKLLRGFSRAKLQVNQELTSFLEDVRGPAAGEAQQHSAAAVEDEGGR